MKIKNDNKGMMMIDTVIALVLVSILVAVLYGIKKVDYYNIDKEMYRR